VNDNQMTTRMPAADGPPSVVSANVDREGDALVLVVYERPLDMSEPARRVEVPLTWGKARNLMHNFASIITTEMAIREEAIDDAVSALDGEPEGSVGAYAARRLRG
jgi:hypothetical protein